MPRNPGNLLHANPIRENFLMKKKQKSGKSSTVNAFKTKHLGMFMPLYWMKDLISAAGEPCIGF
jgi:hypothetical protein